MKKYTVFVWLNLCTAIAFGQCSGPVTCTVSPSPGSGDTYYPGEQVTFCATVNGYNQTVSNWFHGLTINFGNGWDQSTFAVVSVPQPVSGAGNWAYYPTGINSYVNPQHWGPGFYFGTNAGAVYGSFAADTNDPGLNYGDYCSTSSCSWTFCFSVRVSLSAATGSSAAISFTPSSDGQSGSWTGGEGVCNGDSTPVTGSSATVSAPVFFVNTTQSNVTCYGLCNGTATAAGINGHPPYSYKWNTTPAKTTATINNLCAGAYTVTVIDSSHKVDSVTVTITQPAPLWNSGAVTNPVCSGTCTGSVTLMDTGGTAPYSYSWNSSPPQSYPIALGLCAGSVTVVVTDSNGCSLSAVYTLTDPPVLSVTLVSQTAPLCFGSSNGTITVGSSGGNPGTVYYHWSNGEMGATDSLLYANTYRVTVTDPMGCTASASYSVTQPQRITISTPSITPITCNGNRNGAISAAANGGTGTLNYRWIATTDSVAYNGAAISGLGAGNYLLTVTDGNNCQDTASYQLTSPPAIVIDSFTHNNLTCNGSANGSAAIYVHGGTGGFTYTWAGYPAMTGYQATGLSAGTVLVIASDANSCKVRDSTILTQPSAISLTVVSEQQISCHSTGQITVAAMGGTEGSGYLYVWNSRQTGPVDTGLAPGTIAVTVTDANSCSFSQNYVITSPSSLTTNPIVTNVKCNGSADGAINSNPSGGNPPYSFIWSNLQYAQTASALDSGSYTCTISDNSGCQTTLTATVNQPLPISITPQPHSVKCAGQQTGSVSLSVTGGYSPYNYSATKDFSNFIYSSRPGIIAGLDTGTYTIIVADDSACVQTAKVTIAGAIPDVYVSSTDSTRCYGPEYNDGAAHISASNGQNGPYTFSIDESVFQDTGYFANLAAGPHLIVATNANGCVDSVPVVVYQPMPIEVTLNPDSVSLNLGESLAIHAQTANAVNPVYLWDPAAGLSCSDCPDPVLSTYASSVYMLTVSMQNYGATCYGHATLHAIVNDGNSSVFIPDAFSPNGDGNNDKFQLYGENIKTAEMKVFNRWGELVFESEDALAGWDGTYKGQMQSPGVFTYTVLVTLLDNTQIHRTGSIMLVR